MVDLVAQTIKTTGMLLNLAWPHYEEVYPSKSTPPRLLMPLVSRKGTRQKPHQQMQFEEYSEI